MIQLCGDVLDSTNHLEVCFVCQFQCAVNHNQLLCWKLKNWTIPYFTFEFFWNYTFRKGAT